jgi:hypothetical protein
MTRFAWLVVLVLVGSAARAQDAKAPAKLTTRELADWIDKRFGDEYDRAGIKAAPSVDDATFLRRVNLDLLGRIPSVSQLRDFEADTGSLKREQLVDKLLSENERPTRYAQHSSEHLARVWRRMLIPSTAPGYGIAPQMDPWLAKQFSENTPYDQLARKLLLVRPSAPRGLGGFAVPQAPMAEDPDAPAGLFQQAIGQTPANLTSAYVRVFLGVRLNCAQCHDHPFTQWKRGDFWGMAAMLNDAATVSEPRPAPTIKPEGEETLTYTAKLLWTKEPFKEIPANKMPREMLADWMVSPENPNFAATAVNRVWQYLCGRGLAGSVDDLDRVSAEERQALDELAKLFVEAGYDLRWLVTGICKSKVYQQTASRAGQEPDGLVRRPLKTLLPEQVFDSLEQALGLSIAKVDNGPRHNGERQQFVSRMDESAPESPEDYKGGIPQALMLMNGKLTADATSLQTSRTLRAIVEAPFLKPREKIETLYLAALSRKPKESELQYLLEHLEEQPNEEARKEAYAKILWGLLNSPEFVISR